MYDKNWDKMYHNTYKVLKRKALWDVPPAKAVAVDYPIFSEYFNSDLPLLDLGCGTGAQSAYLSKFYNKIVGVDVSGEAISIAKEQVQKESIQFGTLDITQALQSCEVENQHGPFNLYMRGVLHQIKEEHIGVFQDNIATLLGESGKMYAMEVGDSIREHFDQANESFSKLPARLRQVFISNLPPKGLSLTNIPDYFPADKFNVLLAEKSKLNTNINYANGDPIYIPAVSILIENVKK